VLTLTGSASGTTQTDSSGNYQLAVIPGGNYTITPSKIPLAPSASGIDTTDVLAIQRHFFRQNLTGCQAIAADVTGDGRVTTVDVIATQRFFIGLTTGIANVGRYQFSPPSRAYSGIGGNQTNQNYDTLIFGDVASHFAERGSQDDGSF
jgi:hypothetical protein